MVIWDGKQQQEQEKEQEQEQGEAVFSTFYIVRDIQI
jgi:hypothetical protein